MDEDDDYAESKELISKFSKMTQEEIIRFMKNPVEVIQAFTTVMNGFIELYERYTDLSIISAAFHDIITISTKNVEFVENFTLRSSGNVDCIASSVKQVSSEPGGLEELNEDFSLFEVFEHISQSFRSISDFISNTIDSTRMLQSDALTLMSENLKKDFAEALVFYLQNKNTDKEVDQPELFSTEQLDAALSDWSKSGNKKDEDNGEN